MCVCLEGVLFAASQEKTLVAGERQVRWSGGGETAPEEEDSRDVKASCLTGCKIISEIKKDRLRRRGDAEAEMLEDGGAVSLISKGILASYVKVSLKPLPKFIAGVR